MRIVDHSEEYLRKLYERIAQASANAARLLAERYKQELTKTWSFQTPAGPPHSLPGEVPHKYFGHRPGGFQLRGPGEVNNQGQTDFLAEYIESDQGYVGFAPNHTRKGVRGWVTGTNYLITHDPSSGVGQRPWIQPVFEINRGEVVETLIAGLQET